MIDLDYSLVIEATNDPAFFSFSLPDLDGFTGVGHSLEDCVHQARQAMHEHVTLLLEQGLPVPQVNANPTVTVRNHQPQLASS